jgi:hypothetical protein
VVMEHWLRATNHTCWRWVQNRGSERGHSIKLVGRKGEVTNKSGKNEDDWGTIVGLELEVKHIGESKPSWKDSWFLCKNVPHRKRYPLALTASRNKW